MTLSIMRGRCLRGRSYGAGLFLGSSFLVPLGVFFFLLLGGLAWAEEEKKEGRPNVVLIMADDLGYECLGANGGSSYETPVLDGLAAEGVRFEHCYAQPLCTPSRVKIMTGQSNVRNYARFGELPRKERTFAQVLREAGYATCIAGKWQLGKEVDAPQHFGFEQACLWQHTRGGGSAEGAKKYDRRYVNPMLEVNGEERDYTGGEYGPQICADFVCDFIKEHKEEPFLVYYPMILTHCPFDPTPESTDWDPKRLGSTSYKGEMKDYQRHFGDMLKYADKLVGQIVAQLEASGVREKTLILFTGDNGTDQPIKSVLNGQEVAGGKGKMTDAGTRVPLIAHWPGVVEGGRVSQDLVDFSDFFPTLCEAAGVSVPEGLTLDGRSFFPQLKGEAGSPREWVYCWYSRNGKTGVQEWARNAQYKLYRTGEFYEVSADRLEKKALDKVSPEAEKVRTMLQGVLDQYQGLRPTEEKRERKKKRGEKKK